MMADYKMTWVTEIELKKRKNGFLKATPKDLDILDKVTGVYIFARRFGNKYEPIYVGMSTRLKIRLEEHLDSASFLEAVTSGGRGSRVILAARTNPRPGQRAEAVARAVERLLIRKFHLDGFSLLNEHGTKKRVRAVNWRGTNNYLDLVPRAMLIDE